ncbi:MAG TPA: hypothetical protein VJU61_04255 [Polyangiaceae bacterium]|nr:hypothetical protein [Polyangiaceae bacterium]
MSCAVDSRDASVLEPPRDEEGAPTTTNPGPGAGMGGSTSSAGSNSNGEMPGSSLPFIPGQSGPGEVGSAGSSGAGTIEPGPPAGSAGSGSSTGEVAQTEPEVVGGCFNQLLGNGDFDAGHAAWQEVAPVRDVIVKRDHPGLVAAGVAPQSGDYLAWIGGVPNGEFDYYETTLSQDVAIPAETLSLTLTGYVWVAQPQLGQNPQDWAVLEFSDPDPNAPFNGLAWQVDLWNDESVTSGWQYFEIQRTEVERLKGRTLPLIGSARSNGGGTLSVWLDSLRLEARCAR